VPPPAPTGPAGSTACAATSVASAHSAGERHDTPAAALSGGVPAALVLTAVDSTDEPCGHLAHGMDDTGDRPD
jgi:hypothetical protein